jgi:hypothetical protein
MRPPSPTADSKPKMESRDSAIGKAAKSMSRTVDLTDRIEGWPRMRCGNFVTFSSEELLCR